MIASNGLQPGIVAIQRSTPRLLAAMLRDPLAAVPPACFTERMVVTQNFGGRRVYVSDPALVHEALVRNADALAKTAPTKRALAPALGDGLLTTDGAPWKWQRQTLAPAFQHEKVTSLLPAMITAAEATRDRWLALPSRAEIDLGDEMMRTTFRIIIDTMLSGADGIDAAQVSRGVADYLGASPWMFVVALLKAPAWLPFPGKRKAFSAATAMRGTVRGMVAARRQARGGPDDLMAMLLDAVEPDTGRRMTDEEITDNILTFAIAGHETTAVALGWAFALLADHPAIAARLEAEIEAATQGGPVRATHVAGLTYARQVMSETMRLYPPAPLIARAVARDIEIAGVSLPAGSVIFVPIYAIQRHAGLWAEPAAFDPDRFAPDAVRARHRFAYMPFGAGPRICIGSGFALMEAVAVLAVLVKALRLQRVGPMPEALMRLTLRPKTPLRMRILHRAAGEGDMRSMVEGARAMRAPTKTFTRAKSLRRTMTLPEVLLWRDLRRRNAENLHVRRQHAVGPYVLDFYCSNARLGIEVDGAAHDTGAQAAHDLSRDQ